MKKYYPLILSAMVLAGCSSYDDTELREDLESLEDRVEVVENLVKVANDNIDALQGLVAALESNDYITEVTTTADGYIINFSKGDPITISNGKASTIGVAKYTDGKYYWTIATASGETEWLKDEDGNMIRTTGDDGYDGNDGSSPKISVVEEDGILYWQVDGEWLLCNGDKIAVAESDSVVKVEDNGSTVTIQTQSESFTFTKVDPSLSIGLEDLSQTTLTKSNNEIKIILPATLKESDIMAISAEVISSSGATGAGVTTKSGVSQSSWGVEVKLPTYDTNGANNDNATILLTPPANAVTDMNVVEELAGVITVNLIDSEGVKHSSSSSFKYSANGDVDGYMLSSFNSMQYPDCDTWIINDYEIFDIEQSTGLSAALSSAQLNNRDIKIIFPYLTYLTDESLGYGQRYTSLSFPKVKIVYNEALSGYDSLTEVDLPVATIIEDSALSDCSNLTSISLPCVTKIGSNAFYGCRNATIISIPQATIIGEMSFYGCDKLETIIVNNDFFAFEDKTLYNTDKSIIYIVLATYGGDSYTAPTYVKEIGDYAFRMRTDLKSVDLSNVETIGGDVFYGCENLTDISCPNVTLIGSNTFGYCMTLSNIYCPKVVEIGGSAFAMCESIEELSLPSATTFGDQVFFSCVKLKMLEVATNDGVKLASAIISGNNNSFDAGDVDLTLGSANSEYVSGNTLTIDGLSTTFKSITLK